jgi:DHA3 family macrolide efflux protein-like MFS transporter
MGTNSQVASHAYRLRPLARSLPARNSQFCLIWLASLLSQTGSSLSRMALVLWLAGEYGVPMAGALILCETLPGAVTTLGSGAIADRFDKKWLMIGSDLVRLLALLAAMQWPEPAALFTMMCFYSVANSFFQPARSAAVPLVVAKADLARANSLDQGASTAVLIAGPYAGALLLYSVGLRMALAIDAATFLVSALLLLPVEVPRDRHSKRQPVMTEIKEGWSYLRRHPVALEAAVMVEFSVLCVSLWTPLAPAFAKNFLKSDPSLVGLQMGLFGAGGIAGSMAAPSATAKWGKGKLLTGCLVAEAAMMLLYTTTSSPAASSVLIVVWGAIVTVMMVSYNSLLQDTVASGYLGRVFALSRQFENVATVLAMGAATALESRLSPQRSLLSAAVVYLTVSSLYRLSPRGRRLAQAA